MNPAYQDLRHLQYGDIFKKLLGSLATGWAEKADGLPRPLQVIQKLKGLGVWRPDFWDHAAWPVARRLFLLQHQMPANMEELSREPVLELLGWWTMLVAGHAPHLTPAPRTPKKKPLSWPALHDLAKDTKETPLRGFEFEARLYSFFKGLAPEAKRRLSALTLVSIDLLSRDAVAHLLPDSTKADHAGLLKLLLLLVNGRNVSRPAESLRNMLGTFDGTVSSVAIDDYVRQIQQLPDDAKTMITASHTEATSAAEDTNASEEDLEELDPAERKQRLFSGGIQRAQAEQNGPRLQRYWHSITASYRAEESREEKGGIPPLLYDQLIAAFFATRKGEGALEVWKHMIENGTQPTIKTWTAMMDGANKAKDWETADGVWHRLLKSGIVLDEASWVVRMTTLVRANRGKDMKLALEDLGRRWATAASAPDPHALAFRPTMTLVNAVVLLLAKFSKTRDLADVLKWARSFDLAPDVRTYNALLGAAVVKGQVSDMRQLLQQMSDQGIEPDDATYGIMFDHILVHALPSESFTPEELQAKAFEALEDLEKQGMKANDRIYGQLIDRLLKHHNNLPAAEAVVSYMLKQGREPSEHAYTSLITHYFSLDPPNIASVDDIVERVQGKHRRVNNYFYDRVLQGYANADSVERAVRTLRQMRKEMKRPSWQALLDTVLCLERAGEARLLAEVVADVANRETVTAATSGFGKDMRGTFFRTVERLKEEGKIAQILTQFDAQKAMLSRTLSE